MKVRILTALVLLCILVPVLIFSGTVVFPIVAALFCVVAVGEMQACLGTLKKLYISIPACVLAALLPLATAMVLYSVNGVSLLSTPLYLLAFLAIFIVYMFYLFAAAVFCRGSAGKLGRQLSGSY